MKSRIPKIWLSLALAVPVCYGTNTRHTNRVDRQAHNRRLFYANVPARLWEIVTNLKMLPERMDPTCSECNQF
jgi:hypothetical protein